ncbi:DUF885 family protein [Amycolatopsis sp. Poz14]|uniref:DUF885 domain-containing protein n=1 Tax=Amycolatopsis sp. Poz14 TaxID=1447705 RepID=UPI001EE88B70|nr:DUF885 domain-containing protein [Amycolatopsis sp. Poz14]MCG3751899.1 DUF885 domain-containing protein [Amycolatopsis sp. Poz14]
MAEPSDPTRHLADELWAHLQRTQPHFALHAGEPVTQLPRGTYEEASEAAALGRRILAGLDRAPESDVDTSLAAVVRALATQLAGADEDYWWSFPVAPYQSFGWTLYGQQVFRPFAFTAGDEAKRYLSLVNDFTHTIKAAHAKLIGQAEQGIVLPRPALPGFLAAVRAHRAAAAEFLRPAESRLAGLDPATRTMLTDGVDRLVVDDLLPAFDAVLAHLDGPGAQSAVDGIGLGQYPGGHEAYRRLVRHYATYPIEPEEVHELGLKAVAELTEQLAEIRREVGFDGDETAYRAVLEADPRFHAPSPEHVADTYRRHIDAIEPLLDQWFSVRPRAAFGVQRLDPELEAGMTFGYYEQPIAANPVGRYRFNGSGLAGRAQISAAALIFHELVPGHHFHLARQAEDATLHPLQGQAAAESLSAYCEGWAEYAASLGFEMGLFSDPWDHYGACLHQRFVAQRLVVDTGLNTLGWSEDKGREYLSSTTMESPAQVSTEILRYGTDLPAQSLSYRLGFEKFWELRRTAERALGSRFDVREFHETVLGQGTLPLTAVELNVRAYANR